MHLNKPSFGPHDVSTSTLLTLCSMHVKWKNVNVLQQQAQQLQKQHQIAMPKLIHFYQHHRHRLCWFSKKCKRLLASVVAPTTNTVLHTLFKIIRLLHNSEKFYEKATYLTQSECLFEKTEITAMRLKMCLCRVTESDKTALHHRYARQRNERRQNCYTCTS